MNNKYHPANWNVGTKISAFSFALVGIIIAALILTITVTTASLLEERATRNLENELHGVANTVEVFNRTVSSEAVSFGRIFGGNFSGAFESDPSAPVVIGGKPVPSLKHNGKVLNLDFSAP
ncbi:MAG: methyl-accepting chemotaxis protein, partial [Massilia sp.]